jgi:ubiquinone/menaquinone biosynthesis C-methylase UbiE
MHMATEQDKKKEIEFFDAHAAGGEYDVFTPAANDRIVNAFIRLSGLPRGARVLDIGCGTGTFSALLREAGYAVTGVDISGKTTAVGRTKHPHLNFITGDAENLPFSDREFDGVLLSAIVHHFPEPRHIIGETYRVLRRDGRFVAFDPNRMNPFMWLYRDWASPFFSQIGVTENERPVLAWQIAELFLQVGFDVNTEFLANLAYRYVASDSARRLLPIYNFIDRALFSLPFMKPFQPFVLISGRRV